MKTPEQLKDHTQYGNEKRSPGAEFLQMFLFERILDRLANSDYQRILSSKADC